MASNTTTFSSYGRLAKYIARYKGRFAVAIISGLVCGGSVFAILSNIPNLIKPFEVRFENSSVTADEKSQDSDAKDIELGAIGEVLDRFDVPATREDGSLTWQFVVFSVIMFPLVVTVYAVAVYLNRYYLRWIGARLVRDLRDELFDNLQVQSLSFFGRSDVGKLISSCTNNINVVEAVISSTVSDLVRAPFEIIAALVFVVILSVKAEMLSFVLFMSLVFPMCVVPIVILGRYVKRHTVRALERVSDLVSRMHENFTGIRVVKAFYMEKKEAERFRIMNGRYFRSIIKALRAELMMTPLMEAVALIMGAIFIIVCYSRNIRLHELIPIGGAAVWVYHPLKKLAKVNASMQRGAAALQSIYSLLDEKDVLEEKASPVVIKDFTDRVTFEGVGFRYVKSSPLVLENISFQIPKGSVVAVVGETGSGKTTLANLLARFYDPSEGRVLIDGIDLKDVEIASLRKLIGVVTQETVLFNDTIASNISYGMDNVPEEKIIDAAKRANAHDFIISDPEGYQRVVGEKGFVLSGGERQRIAIARAVLRNSPILILDEATSSLDTVTERLVQQAIAEVMKDRTVFAIAHRLSTVKHADQIMLIADGGIAERGSHEELYSMNGRYRKLCDMQVLDN